MKILKMKWLDELKELRGDVVFYAYGENDIDEPTELLSTLDRLIAIAEEARVVYETGFCGSCPICGIYLEHCDPPVEGVKLDVEHHETCPYSDEWKGE